MFVLAQETDFFEQLVALYGPLMAFAMKKRLSVPDAQDLVQEALTRSMERRAQFESGTNLYGWTVKIMTNLMIDKYRKKKEVLVGDDTLGALGGNVESGVSTMLDIRKCLDQLPESQRQPLLMNAAQGFTAREIADLLSSKLNTVLSQLARGRKAFGECIGQVPELSK